MDNLAYINDEAGKIRMELIEGKVVMMSPRPRIEHARACGRIYRQFGNYLDGKYCEAFGDGVDVYIDERNHFIPDVMIVCNPDIIKDDAIYGAPDLVVEVLSPSTSKNDRTTKKDVYERAGVKEYWLVDTWGKSIEVYLLKQGHLRLDETYHYYTDEQKAKNAKLPEDRQEIIRDEIKVSLYEDFIVKLKDIFK